MSLVPVSFVCSSAVHAMHGMLFYCMIRGKSAKDKTSTVI